jgi:oligoendopeptidase F
MNPVEAHDSHACDAKWGELYLRFLPGIDWTGLEDFLVTGWHRKLHIHTYPFYYVEYGLAQLGAVQIWRNSLEDAPAAVAAYRSALALGGTVPLPDLFQKAGARLAFDAQTLQMAVQLMENTILKLDQGVEESA